MFKIFELLLLSPLFVAAMILRLALFLPVAVLFLLPVVIMRPRLILRAPRMFSYMLMARRGGWANCSPGGGRGGRWRGVRLETVTEPVRL